MSSISEQDLNAIFVAMVHQYSATLKRVARSVTRDTSEAEDVVQETFLRVLRHSSRIAELRDTRRWLIHIAWNISLDRKRRAKNCHQSDNFEEVARSLTNGDPSAIAALINAQRHARFLDIIDTLPAKEREVFLLFAIYELSTVEIARRLQTTDSTIRSRLHRARKALQGLVGRDGNLRQDLNQVEK